MRKGPTNDNFKTKHIVYSFTHPHNQQLTKKKNDTHKHTVFAISFKVKTNFDVNYKWSKEEEKNYSIDLDMLREREKKTPNSKRSN